MRTFVALELSEETRANVGRLAAEVAPGMGKVTWVKADRMHLTLKFLGEIEEKAAPRIVERLKEACREAGPISFSVSGVGCFPNPRRAKVVWVGLVGATEPPAELQRRIDDALSGLGFEREGRPFSPHITIGRVRGPIRTERLEEVIRRYAGHEFGSEAIHEIVFMQSQLRPGGPVYTPIARIPLGG
jgi:2'-5' RNA ligase